MGQTTVPCRPETAEKFRIYCKENGDLKIIAKVTEALEQFLAAHESGEAKTMREAVK